MLAKLFFIILESSETHFDLVASKIGAKLNNLVIKGTYHDHMIKEISIWQGINYARGVQVLI